VAFLEVGVPAVEFGPRGAGHHGPEEFVEIESLPLYRRALVEFALLAATQPAPAAEPGAAA
jgi:succinyl-diaminopimelate desuccinylase